MPLRFLVTLVLALALALAGRTEAATPDTVAQLTLKADAGDLASAFELATRFDFGKGVAKNPTAAAAWYLRAAQGGHAEAQNSLGSLYQAGQGVEQSYSGAFTWYQKAADQGHPEATNNLAYLYDEGKGVPEDNVQAIALYEKAAEMGFVRSMVNLAAMYEQGDGVPVNRVEAYKWLDLGRFYTQLSGDKRLKWYVRGLQDKLRSQLTPGERALGEELARQWDKAHRPKNGT